MSSNKIQDKKKTKKCALNKVKNGIIYGKEFALNVLFFLVNKHCGEHDLAKVFNASRHTIVTSWLILPSNTKIINWNTSKSY